MRMHFYNDILLRCAISGFIAMILSVVIISISTYFLRNDPKQMQTIRRLALVQLLGCGTWLALLPLSFPIKIAFFIIFCTVAYIIITYRMEDLSSHYTSPFLQSVFFLFVLFIIIIAFSGWESKYIALYIFLAYLLFLFSVLTIPGFLLLRIYAEKIFDLNQAFLLSIPVTIILFSLVFIPLQALKAPMGVYCAFFLLLILVLLFPLGGHKLIGEIFTINAQMKYGVFFVIIGSMICMCFVSVGLKNPITDLKSQWQIAYRNGFVDLPCDNGLQWDTTDVFNHHRPPWRWEPRTMHSWTMGDRPPLMAVVNSIIAFLTLTAGKYVFLQYQILGTLLNMLFFLPLLYFIRNLFKKRNIDYIIVACLFLNIFVFLNIYYTWPKLFGVYFLLLAVVIVMAHIKEKTNLIIAGASGALWGLGCLSHGGSLLSLPILLIIYIVYTLIKKRFRFAPLIIFVASFFIIQMPWNLYKIINPSIDSNNLIYQYIPVEDPDHVGHTKQNHIKELRMFLQTTPFSQQVEQRMKNFIEFYKGSQFSESFNALTSGDWENYLSGRYAYKFYFYFSAIGEILIVLALIAILIFTANIIIKKRIPNAEINPVVIVVFIVYIIMSYCMNVLGKWTYTINHALPYFELIISMTIFYGLCLSSIRAIKLLSVFLCFLEFGYFVIVGAMYKKYFVLDFYLVMVFVLIGVVFFVTSFIDAKDKDMIECK